MNTRPFYRGLLSLAVIFVALAPATAQWRVRPVEPFRSRAPALAEIPRDGRRGLPPLRLASERPSRVPGQVVVKYARSLPRAKTAAIVQPVAGRVIAEIPQLDVQVLAVDAPYEQVAEQLRKNPDVLWVAPRLYRYPLSLTPNDPAYNELDRLIATDPDTATYYKWDSHMIGCAWGWEVWPGRFYSSTSPKGSDAITVAVIDTGIDYTHPDFINAGGTGTSVDQGGQLLSSQDVSIFSGIVTPGAADDYGHGTHVAGIIAAATNNSRGTVGTGYNANIMSIKVVDAMGNGTDTDVAQAIVYAVDHGALIINLSLGSYEYSQVEQDAVNYAWRKNVLVVAAAGNDGSDKLNYPSALSKVLSVAATSRLTIATYSNYGPFVGICAPGGDFDFEIMWLLGVYSTMPTYEVALNDPNVYGAAMNYDYLMGTSMAAPHVAGAAAIRAGQKGYTRSTPNANLKLWQALQRSAFGDGGWSPYFGYGLVAVEMVVQEDSIPNWRGDTTGCITGQVRYRGTPVQNATVSARLMSGGTLYSATSRSDGGYRIANVPKGTYRVTATFYGETQRIENVVVTAGCDIPGVDFNVAAFPTSLTLEDATGTPGTDVTFRATFLRSDTNDPVEDIRIYFSLDGTELGSSYTDWNGIATYRYRLPGDITGGVHEIRADYYGEGAYQTASATASLSIPGGLDTTMYTMDRTGTITESVTLRQYDLKRVSDNTLLVGRTITYRVDGTVVGTAVTDSGGDSMLNWVIPEGPASRTITVSFAGDTTHAPCSASATLTCQTWSTRMAVFDRTARITDTTELKARLVRSDSVPLYNKTINFYVDGTFVISRQTDVEGYARYPYYTVPEGVGAGTRTITSEWTGNGGYLPISKNSTLTVLRALPYIWVMPRSVPQGQTARLYAYFRRLYDYGKQEGKTVSWFLDGTWIGDSVTGTAATGEPGVARFNYDTSALSPGAHTLRCEWAGDAWVEPGFGQATLTIY